MAKIYIEFEQKDLHPISLTCKTTGDSILDYCLEANIDLHHNCGGVCACSTCHIYVQKGQQYLGEISEKEENFIDRAVSPRIESRLACQCIIEDENTELFIKIPDQTQFFGE
ncbi:MAG: 2Fe-2S iron-sulfur cluster-binding protein [Sediminibacterium sp.]|nr:2Fe-2S iron-sulfur cluster-binding protein [Sediminibacterium sp.]